MKNLEILRKSMINTSLKNQENKYAKKEKNQNY